MQETLPIQPVRPPPAPEKVHVVVTGVEIPFTHAVALLVTFALASIPALLILSVVAGVVIAVFSAVFVH
jgi:hypothetical protein